MYGNIIPNLRIKDAFCSGKIDLHISLKKAVPLRYGLKNLQVRQHHLTEIHELDMMQIAAKFPGIEHLRICGRPGSVAHMDALLTLEEVWDVMESERGDW